MGSIRFSRSLYILLDEQKQEKKSTIVLLFCFFNYCHWIKVFRDRL